MFRLPIFKGVASVVAATGLVLGGAVAASANGTALSSDAATASLAQEGDGNVVDQFESIDEIDTSSGSFEPAPATITPMASSGLIKAGSCGFKQHVDNVHVTRGEASVHGWWTDETPGKCPDTAKVKVYLQAWFCSSVSGCRWVTVETGTRTIKEGTSKRANARNVCKASKLVGWRGVTDVDLTGKIDPAGVVYGSSYDRMCEPSN